MNEQVCQRAGKLFLQFAHRQNPAKEEGPKP